MTTTAGHIAFAVKGRSANTATQGSGTSLAANKISSCSHCIIHRRSSAITKKFEFDAVIIKGSKESEIPDILSSRGAEGWDVFHVIQLTKTTIVFYLKREVEEKNETPNMSLGAVPVHHKHPDANLMDCGVRVLQHSYIWSSVTCRGCLSTHNFVLNRLRGI